MIIIMIIIGIYIAPKHRYEQGALQNVLKVQLYWNLRYNILMYNIILT